MDSSEIDQLTKLRLEFVTIALKLVEMNSAGVYEEYSTIKIHSLLRQVRKHKKNIKMFYKRHNK